MVIAVMGAIFALPLLVYGLATGTQYVGLWADRVYRALTQQEAE